MKTLVTRSLALLLTLALLFTVTPFTALAEAAENEDGMDEIMDILETYEEETEVSAEPGEALTDSTEETAPAEDAYALEDSEEYGAPSRKAVVNGTVAHITAIFGMTLSGLVLNDIYKKTLKA